MLSFACLIVLLHAGRRSIRSISGTVFRARRAGDCLRLRLALDGETFVNGRHRVD
ncbi:hypothetical protein KCP73_13850 [Salmonella enterica subsp. enterica]|nr:hypothetical protein KCP73_13850 [Salmonella enterica subsp. enterica]